MGTLHAQQASFLITLKGGAARLRCGPEQTVLAAMEAAGLGGRSVGCRGGGCGRCRVRVESGAFTTGKMSRAHVSPDDERNGLVLACRLYPRGDLVIAVDLPQPAATTG